MVRYDNAYHWTLKLHTQTHSSEVCAACHRGGFSDNCSYCTSCLGYVHSRCLTFLGLSRSFVCHACIEGDA